MKTTLTTEDTVLILRVLHARIGRLLYTAGPGTFAGEEHGWLNEQDHEEHDKLRALCTKIADAVLGNGDSK
jgi:hypothetical protein